MNFFSFFLPVFSSNLLAASLFSGGLSGHGKYGSHSKVNYVTSLSPSGLFSPSSIAPSSKQTPSSKTTTQYSLPTNAILPTLDPPLPTSATQVSEDAGRRSRPKRQLYTRGFDGNIMGAFASSFPVFSSNLLAESLFPGGLSSLFDGGRYGSESKVHSVSSLSPSGFLSPSNSVPHYDSMEQFPNPFPTVPMDSFDFEAFKSASEDDAVFGKTGYAATAFPPMNFNPQTGTFYEPVFGSHIPASLMGDFTPITSIASNRLRFPPKIIAPVTNSVVENSTSKIPVASPTGKAKLVAYEYMYKPFTMLRASSKRPPLRDRIPVSTTQISYEKVNLPPLRDTLEPTSKPTYKLDSPQKAAVNAAPVTWYTTDQKEASNPIGGFTGMSADHFISKPVFTPDKNSDYGRGIFATSASFSSGSSKQKQNFAYKPMHAPSTRTIAKPASDSRDKYSQNQLTPQVTYASQPELPLKHYRDHHQSFNKEPILSYQPPAYPVKSPPARHEKAPADTKVRPSKEYSIPAPDAINSIVDSDPWKYIATNPVVPDIPRPVFVPAVKTFTSPPFRKHRPLFPESPSHHQTTNQAGSAKQPDRGHGNHQQLPPDHGPEVQYHRPDIAGVADPTPGYGQKLNSKLTTSSQRNKITPPQVVKSVTYHQTARPPYTRPYPISTTTSHPPPASTTRPPIELPIRYDIRVPEVTRQRFPASASQNIPNARPEPEDDSQEYTMATPKLQSLQYMDLSSTTTSTESSENRDHRTMYETNIDYVDSDSKPESGRNTESSKSIIRLQTNAARGNDKNAASPESGDDRLVEELDEDEEVEQTIQTPPPVKNGDEAKKTINLFKKRPDYTKLYSKYTKSTASPVYRSSSTTAASTTVPSSSTTTTAVAPNYSPSLHYDSEDEDRDRQSPSSFGSRLSHTSRDPVVSVKTSTSTKTIKSYPYSPKPTTGTRNKLPAEKSEASDADHRWTKYAATSTTSAPPKSFPTVSRSRSRISSTTTWRPATSLTHSWTATSTTAATSESTTPALFVGKLGNLQDLGMFDVDDPEEEEAIDVPVFSKDVSEATTSSSTSDPLNHFRRVYTSNTAGALNARLTGQRVTKNTGHLNRSASGYLNSFFGEAQASQQPPSQGNR